MSSSATTPNSVPNLPASSRYHQSLRFEPHADGSKFTITLSFDGIIAEQFELPKDSDLFYDLQLKPDQAATKRTPLVHLGWVVVFLNLNMEERRDKYDNRFEQFMWATINEARKAHPL
ncbi:hypothetical protein HBH98_243980 [Parastagonospora nodorum]|nr:hypothetical protein HBH53_230570 [Parastagonospora nodorum]KAH3956350.1 hypothetical protein HBH51_243920 [Parastagonospora nodorum]KAH4215534.1 hypothetical protein HBI06_247970 [Parastagonospora nodorum]KAH4224218.1 hypothetical protein HBI05_242110 [Parastagonospora nodorum]KAH4334261.1 hypothetical protein HBH98_243980 [Parastagonospora nodorum]